MTSSKSRLISRDEYADRMSVSVRTTEYWQKRGIGPQPVRVGHKIRYLEDEVEAFISTLKESA